MAVQNSTVERPALHAPALSQADEAAHEAASYIRPTVDVAQVLTALAATLLAAPDAHLDGITVTRAVLDIAGPQVSLTALRPVWDALPLGGHGNLGYTHAEYAALLVPAARGL